MAWTSNGIKMSMQSSKWKGKIWSLMGDSNTEYNSTATKKYHDIIKERTGCIIKNYGRGGSGWFNSWNGNLAYYLRLDTIDPNSDLITFLGGGNDYAETEKPFVLGQFGDTDPVATFYGALDHTLKTIITMYPEKTIAMFTQFRRNVTTPTNAKLESMVKAELEVAAKYGIPCLNLYHNANQYPWIASWRTNNMPDGIHLNDLGHQKLVDKIHSFLESL